MKKILGIVFLLAVSFVFFNSNGTARPPGVIVAESPVQHENALPSAFDFNGYRLTPLAHFEMTGLVLSRKRYHTDRESDLAPVDLALGWGRMSDAAVLERIKITQSGRWYRWRTDNFPIPRREIETSSANMHLIPADSHVRKGMLAARKGDVVRFSGYLVRADAPDGWRWISSLTRTDTGDGACEVVYVKEFFRLP
ncbi:hypothetical protein LZ24_03090 [Desulfobotulus alkaliphilus]|uniref:Uncharacterized protein n=1 Tax=Desulfobotulus alkaliphilus TaxID=622671 RepID=A0A562R6U8_9BACT|nr:hypothetical protein [Desulfobotulus alkaliphilus]TWI64822.1 hypothetical protein LZ24_03090 [Desulfobotulus alkaliphilus]